ncbi:MAG: 3-oxoacyl-[acyl-carrier-protein] synthase III C-terminal domain-containing protein [Nakamurella sp.]
MQPFVVNQHGRLVFPSNFLPDLDFSVIETEAQLDGVIRRDFETKAPKGTEIQARIESGQYASRYELMRDVALNLFWVNRFAMTMYDKQPVRWRDAPRNRDDFFIPIVAHWRDREAKVSAVDRAYRELGPTWDGDAEDAIWRDLFDVFGNRTHDATKLPSVKPTVAEALLDPTSLTLVLQDYDPDYGTHSFDDIVDCHDDVPELEALQRWAMVLHNQYPWDRSKVVLKAVGELDDDDIVVTFRPRTLDVLRFINRMKKPGDPAPVTKQTAAPSVQPIRPYPPTDVRKKYAVLPKIEALAVVKGEIVCSNEDLIRNAAYCWSPMSAHDISSKTGIESRMYTARDLSEIALDAAVAALKHSGRKAEEIGAVIFCSCTSHRMMPSMATWLSGQLGIYQTHSSVDMVAACAGLAYGLSECVRLLQEVERPVLLVCGEKFSDKIGTVRPSRMIFGDGAAAMVIAPAPPGEKGDIDLLQTYASGPFSQVNSIIWPNPAFDNNITVFGPEVKDLAGRYLGQMIDELKALPDPGGVEASAWNTVELVVPHQANKTMVLKLAAASGLSADKLFFNIETMGNTSSASIPIAIADAVTAGVIDSPVRIFAPGFGAGAVAGYAVMTIDPAVIAPSFSAATEAAVSSPAATDIDNVPTGGKFEDAGIAFGG